MTDLQKQQKREFIRDGMIELGWTPTSEDPYLEIPFKKYGRNFKKVPYIVHLSKFPDQLKELSITYKDIEDQISTYDIKKYKETTEAEYAPLTSNDCLKYVMSNQIFVDFLKINHVPTQEEFLKQYDELNKEYFEEMFNKNGYCIPRKQKIIDGLPYRMTKMYKAFVREIHGILYFKQFFKNATLIYNVNLDTVRKVDLLIDYKEALYGIDLYVNSHWKKEKEEDRPCILFNVERIKLPLEHTNCIDINGFLLYNESYVPVLKTLIGYTE